MHDPSRLARPRHDVLATSAVKPQKTGRSAVRSSRGQTAATSCISQSGTATHLLEAAVFPELHAEAATLLVHVAPGERVERDGVHVAAPSPEVARAALIADSTFLLWTNCVSWGTLGRFSPPANGRLTNRALTSPATESSSVARPSAGSQTSRWSEAPRRARLGPRLREGLVGAVRAQVELAAVWVRRWPRLRAPASAPCRFDIAGPPSSSPGSCSALCSGRGRWRHRRRSLRRTVDPDPMPSPARTDRGGQVTVSTRHLPNAPAPCAPDSMQQCLLS
jgi:hypothetical protein